MIHREVVVVKSKGKYLFKARLADKSYNNPCFRWMVRKKVTNTSTQELSIMYHDSFIQYH